MKRILLALMLVGLVVVAFAGTEHNQAIAPCSPDDFSVIAEVFEIFSLETTLLELLVTEDEIGGDTTGDMVDIIETQRSWYFIRRDLPGCAFVYELDRHLHAFFIDWMGLAMVRRDDGLFIEVVEADERVEFAEELQETYEDSYEDLRDIILHLRQQA